MPRDPARATRTLADQGAVRQAEGLTNPCGPDKGILISVAGRQAAVGAYPIYLVG